MASYGFYWRPYVSVAQRRAQAKREMAALKKKGIDIQPVEIAGRKITHTFWGQAWCSHLESYSDYENRLPRGRTYVRNGSVCHLEIKQGTILAKVAGQDVYDVQIDIQTLPKKKWQSVKQRCAGHIGSLIELLQGKLSDRVMQVVTDRQDGLFPAPGEIWLHCDCPDWAYMCKHLAAVLYGIGARLDDRPELLFTLRGVDHDELIATDAEAAVSAATSGGKSKRLAGDDLGDVFGIDIETADEVTPPARTRRKKNAAKTSITPTPAKKKKTARKASRTSPSNGKRSTTKTTVRGGQARRKKTVTKAGTTPVARRPVTDQQPSQKKSSKKTSVKKKVTKKKSVNQKQAAVKRSTGQKKAATKKSSTIQPTAKKRVAGIRSAAGKKAVPRKRAGARMKTSRRIGAAR